MRTSPVCYLVLCFATASSVVAGEPVEFETHRIGSFRSEACCVGDFTGDGRLDIAAGPFVYVAPDWRPWKIRELKGHVDEQGKGYYRDFANLPLDVDGDGRLDIVTCDWFDMCIDWYRNTGPDGPLWPRTLIEVSNNYECADLVDIDGDGRAEEILAHLASTVWYERVKGADGDSRVVKHVVSEEPYEFGAGVGDVNSDGRPDILRPNAWYEAPANLRTGRWIEHSWAVGNLEENKAEHTPQMYVCDVNADGLNDVITSSAHRHGIFWYQQIRTAGRTTWKQHVIDDTWSQAHSLTLADLSGDGTPDLITGKRHLAHNGNDPGSGERLGVYWYELQRGPKPKWTRHVVSRSEGIGSGLNIPVVDLDGDGDLDIVVTGKFGGPVWFENKTKNPALDREFQKLSALEVGQSLEAFHVIRQEVVQSRTDEKVRKGLEARLIAILEGDATDLARDYACRQLAIVGSDTSIRVLAELLPNPRLSYMARYAMEGIGSPAAIQTLREMLGKTDERQKVGVVISLGRLADGGAVSELSALLDEEDDELREVAVVALGRIGTVSAANALSDFAGNAPAELSNVVVAAQLHAAELLCQQDEHLAAAELCESLLSADSEPVRAAAFRGLISAKPSESLAMILAGLTSKEPWKRTVAADCVADLDQPEEITTIALAVPDLPDLGKIAALVSLRNRCNPAVRKAALMSLDQAKTEVRLAALAALIASGTAEDVAVLVDLASTVEDNQVRDAASETLRLMSAEGTNEAMIALMNGATAPNPVVVRCALARRSPEFVLSFLKAAESSDEATRLQAFKALEIMATGKEAEALADLLRKSAPDDEREAAGRAVWMSCQRITNPALRSAPLLAAMEKADAAGQCAILPSLARLGGEQSLSAVHKAMQSKNQEVRDAGYRALANWPDATVADELLDIAKTSEVGPHRIWSLRAYARVVSLPSDRPPQDTFEMLNSAMELATRTEDREFIVSRLGSVRVPDALTLLLSLLDDRILNKSAVPAVFVLAKGLSQFHPDQAKAALERIQPMTKDEAILQQIPKVLRDIEARKQKQEP